MDQLFNVSGIPVLLTMAVVNRQNCVECGSRKTWLLDSVAPFTYRSMRSRMCDHCGRCTSAHTDLEGPSNVEPDQDQTADATRTRRPSEGPYLRSRGELRALQRDRMDRGHRLPGM